MIVMVIGGTRSGKSEVAERVAARLGGPVTVIAPAEPSDPEFAARVAAHRARRPPTWTTIESKGDVVAHLGETGGTVVVDSLGTWVAAARGFTVDADGLVATVRARTAPAVLVTEEVGLAVHAPTELGRRFADALGSLNTAVAAAADQVLLVVAGRVVRLKPADDALAEL